VRGGVPDRRHIDRDDGPVGALRLRARAIPGLEHRLGLRFGGLRAGC
jgi:hypothetical protein